MKNAHKTEFILNLEKDQSDPFEEILKPKNIIERSRRFLTVSEAEPTLTRIAREEGLNLNLASEFKEAVRLMDMAKALQQVKPIRK